MPKIKILDPIFNAVTHFIFNETKRSALNYLRKNGIEPLFLYKKWEQSAGMHYGDGVNCFILVPKLCSNLHVILAHEALHATVKILTHKGIKLSDKSEEMFTYYQGFLLQSMIDALKKHKIKNVLN